VAISPVLVWFSAEARSYALLVFLAAVALWLFARALRTSSVTSLTLWAVASALAVTTHYFAVFLAAPQAVLLVRRAHRRRSAMAAAGVIAASAATLPLALHQASWGPAAWIGRTPLAGRVAALPGDLTVGFDARPRTLLASASALAVAAGAALAYRHASGGERAGAATLGALALAALAAPVALALAGADYLDGRNSLAVAIPLAIALGVGFTAAGRAGRIAAAGLVTLSLGVVVAEAGQPKFHSEDWRAAAEDLGASNGVRAVVATPGQAGRKPLDYYLGGTPLPWRRNALVREVDVVALPRQGQSRVEPAYLARLFRLRLPGFRLVRRHVEHGFALLAYRAPRATPVSQAMLDARVKRGAATVLSIPRPSRALSTHAASAAVKS
jgi:mannosyltransferase